MDFGYQLCQFVMLVAILLVEGRRYLAMMNMYKMFQASPKHEQGGVVIEYGDCVRIRIARAGGSNRRYAKTFQSVSKPYRRAIQTETLSDEKAREMLYEVFARSIVLEWESKTTDGKWQPGIQKPDGTLIPVTVENIVATFQALPDLFLDLQEQANKLALFREAEQEDDAGNSQGS